MNGGILHAVNSSTNIPSEAKPYPHLTRTLAIVWLIFVCTALLEPSDLSAATLPNSEQPFYRQLTSSTQLAGQESVLMRIRSRGNVMTLGVSYDFPPFSFLGEGGELQGFDIDLFQAIARDWNVHVEFLPTSPADITILLSNGAVDFAPMIWPAVDVGKLTMAPTNVNFSQPYLTDQWCLLTAKDDQATLFKGRASIGYVSGFGQPALLQQLLTKRSLFGDAIGSSFEMIPFRENSPALSALRAQQLQHYLTVGKHCNLLDLHQNDAPARESPPLTRSGVAHEALSLADIRFVWGLADDGADSRKLLNYTLQTLVQSGEYDKIFQRWFPEQPLPLISIFPGRFDETFTSLTAARPKSDEQTQVATSELGFNDKTQNMTNGSLAAADVVDQDRGASSSSISLRVGVPSNHPPFGVQVASPPISSLRHNTDLTSIQEIAIQVESSGLVGFDIDVAVEIVTRIQTRKGYSFQKNSHMAERVASDTERDAYPLQIEFVPTTPQTGHKLLSEGVLDMVIAATSPRWRGSSSVSYSEPYLWDHTALLHAKGRTLALEDGTKSPSVGSGGPSGIPSPSLIAYVVGDLAASLWLAEFNADDTYEAFPFQELLTAGRMLEAGQADAMVGGRALLQYVAGQSDNLELIETSDSSIAYSIAVASSQVALRRMVNSIIWEMTLDGTLSQLTDKWLDQGNPTTALLAKTLDQRVEESSTPLTVGDLVRLAESTASIAPIGRTGSSFLKERSQGSTGGQASAIPIAPSAETVIDARAVPDTGADTGTDTGTDTGADMGADTGADTGADMDADAGVDRVFERYVAGDGDTLSSLAVRFYDDQSKWLLLYEANLKAIGGDPNALKAGTELYVPRIYRRNQ